MRVLPEYELVDRCDGAPIVLIGPPRKLLGQARLVNPGAQKVVLREARLCDLPQKTERGRALAAESPLQVTAVLLPGESDLVPVRAKLDAATPPGIYDATVMVGQHRYPAQLHVTEDVDLQVSPETIVVENRPGTRAQKEAVFRNVGNVPLTIASPGALAMDEEFLACRTIRATLADASENAQTIDDWISAYLREGKRQLDRIGLLWVERKEGDLVLAPGETAHVEFMVRIPDTLDPSARYFAFAPFYTATIHFTIVPAGGATKARRST
jgi:hypothetical protein